MAEGRTRRRGKDLLDAIHTAAVEEAAASGPGRLTMDAIAKRAATARTTLYRRWSDPVDLLLDALAALHPVEQPAPGADDLRGDLIASLRLMVDWGFSPAGRAVMALLADPARDPAVVEALWERVFDRRGGTFTQTVLRHYAANGIVDPDRLTPVVLDIGEAMVAKRILDTGEAPDDDYLAAVVDQAILPALALPHRDR
ncbi:TetR/AcrR family transcriptional regulator C-terminal ligand-binding domain-containing protein [Glycomyces scopariae]|uniref:Transcriptional regulator, TetR family n=1 Tax=Glycomyces sambucus TaxID=380244 RepID=A0A1G9H8G4_9ACTN|nr:TetR/AcrR family transcriptional regulator [Glycomyces sambucus]SDL09230.1 transcriptional regulator, TetR family [Glycomyces sambucus]